MNDTYKRGIGNVSTPLLAQLSQAGKNIFTVAEAAKILGRRKSGVHKLLHDLVERKWLYRIEKGKYMILPLSAGLEAIYTEHEFIVASALIEPYYIGFWSALNFYGLTEQVPRTIFIASVKQKQRIDLQGVEYRFIKLSKKKFFGFREEWIGNNKILISDKEKTILDCLCHPEYCGGISEVNKGILSRIEELDLDKMVKYALRMDNGALFKRLGYLLEMSQVSERVIEKIKKHITKGYSLLDPTLPGEGEYVSRWKIQVNTTLNNVRL